MATAHTDTTAATSPGESTGSRTSSSLFARGLDSTAGTSFIQDRLVLMGKTVFLLSFPFLWLMVLSVTIFGGMPFADVVRMPVARYHLLASSVMGLLWLLAKRPTTSRAWLGALDAVSVILGGVFLGLMSLSSSFKAQEAMGAVTVTTMARAVLVPSRPLRTAVISSLAFLPTLLLCIIYPRPAEMMGNFTVKYQELHLALNTLFWAILGVILTSFTSRTIYGLRKQIAEVTELGQYILEEKIGSGGMGEVWRARHRLLIRPAAVKVIRREALSAMAGDPELLMRRFEREARATAALKSPHTVQLYDFGATDDGTLYYVMELLEGLDLDTLVKRYGPIPAERAAHILRQACLSLADAHANGLVHRDVKPANLIVSRAGTTFDFVKVLDFGLVKLDSAQRADEQAVKLTADGSTSGTPGFMAPEVVIGAATTDHRVDVYSLGCVAYWLLTGKLVFEGKTPMEVMIEHARTPATPPSHRVELAIPQPFEDLVMECLEKDPARRPAGADAIIARLDVIHPTEPWTSERAERWWSSNRPVAAGARPLADILLSQEGRQVRIGQRARKAG
jgi:serine/threonine-protein kinase